MKLSIIVSQHSKKYVSVESKNLKSYPKLLLVVPGSIFHEHVPRSIAFMVVFFSGQQLVILTSCSILRIGVNSCLPYTSSNYTQLLSTELLLHY